MKLEDLSAPPRPIARALANEKLFTQALFSRPESLSHLLPYEEYIEATRHFRHKDGSLGAVFEAEILEHEPMPAAQIIAQVDGLKSWFQLPENCVLQVLFDQSPISPLDPEFSYVSEKYPGGHTVSRKLFEARLETLKKSCLTPGPRMPMRRRTLVSIRYFPEI